MGVFGGHGFVPLFLVVSNLRVGTKPRTYQITLFGVAAPILWVTSLFLAFKAYKLSRAERKSTTVYNRLGGDIAIVVIFLDLVFFLPIIIYILGFIFEALI